MAKKNEGKKYKKSTSKQSAISARNARMNRANASNAGHQHPGKQSKSPAKSERPLSADPKAGASVVITLSKHDGAYAIARDSAKSPVKKSPAKPQMQAASQPALQLHPDSKKRPRVDRDAEPPGQGGFKLGLVAKEEADDESGDCVASQRWESKYFPSLTEADLLVQAEIREYLLHVQKHDKVPRTDKAPKTQANLAYQALKTEFQVTKRDKCLQWDFDNAPNYKDYLQSLFL